MNIKRYDSLCKLHSNLYTFYWINWKKNLCIYCKLTHKNHKLIDLCEFNYSEKNKNKLEKQIKYLKNKIKMFDNIKKIIIEEMNVIKDSNELVITFLLHCYDYEENQNNLSYKILFNFKNFEKEFQLNKIEKINEEGDKYISILQNLENNNKSVTLKKYNNHTCIIYHLLEFKEEN